jgi:uncharacterized oxidoreductase
MIAVPVASWLHRVPQGAGIGRGLAEALYKLGNKVIIAGRRRSYLDVVIAANPGMEAGELDITDPTSINQVAAKLIAEHPDLSSSITPASCNPTRPPVRSTMR